MDNSQVIQVVGHNRIQKAQTIRQDQKVAKDIHQVKVISLSREDNQHLEVLLRECQQRLRDLIRLRPEMEGIVLHQECPQRVLALDKVANRGNHQRECQQRLRGKVEVLLQVPLVSHKVLDKVCS